MRAPSFWWREAGIAAALLAPFATLYGAVAARRMQQAGRKVGIPVVCVGNLTLGGAGKTPTALAIGRMLAETGERPFFLTRGYGGHLAGPVRVEPGRHDARDVGDEAVLLARIAPTIVARDRAAGGEAARQAGASVVVMDDGFQNPALAKDLALVVVDAARQIGNAKVFPAGPLRAPLAAQLTRAHALIVIGEATVAPSVMDAAKRDVPVFHGRLMPDAGAVAALAGRQVLAFAGIGDPQKFFATLDAAGIAAPVRRGFGDHHRYSEAEASTLLREADERQLSLVTTEKDAARLAGDATLHTLAERAQVLPVALRLDEEDAFRRFLTGRLKQAN
jgi:tetraacyldisaccharide 4'-kinase